MKPKHFGEQIATPVCGLVRNDMVFDSLTGLRKRACFYKGDRMEKFLTVIQVVAPIFVTVLLGIFARRRKALSPEEIQGMQRFVIKFCIPCLLFRSCLTADITSQALSSMALVPPFLLLGAVWGFWLRNRKYPYHNLPFLLACKETGMMGIPLFMALFGVDQAYRMGVLDLAQAVVAFPMLGILSADSGENLSVKTVVRQIVTSPLIIMSLLGITLNLSGIWSAVEAVGMGGIVTETVSFLSQPVSAVMLFCVGYNFTMREESRASIIKLSLVHIGYFAVAGLAVQGILFLLPGVDAPTRWATILYFVLPASYLTPGLGRNRADFELASGVCSLTTVLCLAAFCVMAAVQTIN